MRSIWTKLAIVFVIAFTAIVMAATHDPWDGTKWDVTSPDIDQPIGNHYKEMYDLRKGIAIRMNKEHQTLATSSAGGEHIPGGCAILFYDDTTAVDANVTASTFVHDDLIYDTTLLQFFTMNAAEDTKVAIEIGTAGIADANITTAKIADANITTAKLAAATSQALAPTGAIISYAGSSAPSGWFICDGNAVSRTTYSDLYTVVGTTYGVGDGSTTFNIPDLVGYFVRGLDEAQAVDPDVRTLGSTQQDGIIAHVHRVQTDDYGDSDDSAYVGRGDAAIEDSSNVVKSSGPYDSTDSTYIGKTETRPVNIALNYIIKY